MPVGELKNRLYTAALPVLGKQCRWKAAFCAQADDETTRALTRLLKRHHVVGSAIQVIRGGKAEECYTAGNARLTPQAMPVQQDTIFRTASVAKMAAALLVFRMQTLGMLDVDEDISSFLGYSVRNLAHPSTAITLGMLLSHTSSIVDFPGYFSAFAAPVSLKLLLSDCAAFSTEVQGARFQYSNFAAGMVGCLLEARFERSFEALAQEYLFEPLGATASFDLTALAEERIADCYRVLPSSREPAFDAAARHRQAKPQNEPDPEYHYVLASGNLFITAKSMSKLLLPCLQTDHPGFLNERSIRQMKTATGRWPQEAVRMQHGMGLLELRDEQVSPHTLYGHQGFAYGAVNGCFFTDAGDGFVSLNNGASEARVGHLSLLNRDLIRLFLNQ